MQTMTAKVEVGIIYCKQRLSRAQIVPSERQVPRNPMDGVVKVREFVKVLYKNEMLYIITPVATMVAMAI